MRFASKGKRSHLKEGIPNQKINNNKPNEVKSHSIPVSSDDADIVHQGGNPVDSTGI
jgi:hypothetical protein